MKHRGLRDCCKLTISPAEKYILRLTQRQLLPQDVHNTTDTIFNNQSVTMTYNMKTDYIRRQWTVNMYSQEKWRSIQTADENYSQI